MPSLRPTASEALHTAWLSPEEDSRVTLQQKRDGLPRTEGYACRYTAGFIEEIIMALLPTNADVKAAGYCDSNGNVALQEVLNEDNLEAINALQKNGAL